MHGSQVLVEVDFNKDLRYELTIERTWICNKIDVAYKDLPKHYLFCRLFGHMLFECRGAHCQAQSIIPPEKRGGDQTRACSSDCWQGCYRSRRRQGKSLVAQSRQVYMPVIRLLHNRVLHWVCIHLLIFFRGLRFWVLRVYQLSYIWVRLWLWHALICRYNMPSWVCCSSVFHPGLRPRCAAWSFSLDYRGTHFDRLRYESRLLVRGMSPRGRTLATMLKIQVISLLMRVNLQLGQRLLVPPFWTISRDLGPALRFADYILLILQKSIKSLILVKLRILRCRPLLALLLPIQSSLLPLRCPHKYGSEPS